jgi:hypothetical protein
MRDERETFNRTRRRLRCRADTDGFGRKRRLRRRLYATGCDGDMRSKFG